MAIGLSIDGLSIDELSVDDGRGAEGQLWSDASTRDDVTETCNPTSISVSPALE